MLKNRLVTAVFASVLSFSSLYGVDSLYLGHEKSLIGVEVGYGSLSYESTDSNYSPARYDKDHTRLTNLGLKIGAESENYRVFLSGRYYKDFSNDFDYVVTTEAEIDYLFNVSKNFNIFAGANIGIASMKFQVKGESFSRTVSDAYYGGNMGVNIHANDEIDLELGSKIISIDASNLKDKVEYRFNTMMTAYFSVIFKYQMD